MEDKKIAILGCGNLGISILNGLLTMPNIKASNITVTKRNKDTLEHYKSKGVQISNDNNEAVKSSQIIIIALKPYNILEVLDEIKGSLNKDTHILVSLATGVLLKDIQKAVVISIPVFRAMPNTAADVSTAMTCICSNTEDREKILLVHQCFDSIGQTLFINEGLMDAATVLGACGIAFVLRFMRAMVQGGIQIGFDSTTANTIVNQTVLGAAQLLSQRNQHPEFEIDKVTTPKGCTITGLNEMEHNGFSSALIKGIVTSYEAIEK